MQAECVHNACRMRTGCMHAKRRRNADVMHTACIRECVQVAPRAYDAKRIPPVHPGYSDSCAVCHWSVWMRAECIRSVHGMYAETIQKCIHNQCKLHANAYRMHNAYDIKTECMQKACTMQTDCLHNVYRMHAWKTNAKCRRNAYSMHARMRASWPTGLRGQKYPNCAPWLFRFLCVLPLERLGACRMYTEFTRNACRKHTECR